MGPELEKVGAFSNLCFLKTVTKWLSSYYCFIPYKIVLEDVDISTACFVGSREVSVVR